MADPQRMPWASADDQIVAPAPMGPLPSPPDKPDKANPGVGYEMKPDGSAAMIPGGIADPNRVPALGDVTKHGPEYLDTLPANIRSRVQQLVDGRSLLTAREKGTPLGQQLMDAANQADPTFDENVSHARYVERTQYTGQGKGSQAVQAAERLAQHVNDLYSASQSLPGPNLGFAPLSNLAATVAQSFDQKDVATYNSTLPLIAGELQKLTKNGAATEAESKQIMDNLAPGKPKDVREAAIKEIVRLGRAQFDPLRQSWASAWQGSTVPPMPMDFSPRTMAIFDAIENGKEPVKLDQNGNLIAAAGAVGNGGATPSGGGGPPGTPPNGPPPITPPVLSPGDPKMEAATGDTRRVLDKQLSSEIDGMVRRGASYNDINGFVTGKGGTPIDPKQYAAVVDFLKQHPDYKGPLAQGWRTEPLSTAQKVITTLGDNAAGAYAVNAGQFLSGNTLDNLAADPAKAREAMNVVSTDHPVASTLGQVSGGVMSSMLGEAGLARAGMGAGLVRGTLADMAMGTANGAGAADDGSRFAGGVRGGLTAGAASLGGRGLMNGMSRVVAPTGGAMSDLYAAGVRPTIGQRLVDVNGGKGFTGTMGRAVNATEEGLQSVPIVGAAIKGARQEARDQFQIGAFNDSLKEIGEELPKGTRPGTDPHKFAQEAFSRAYDSARTGMQMVADQDFHTDVAALAPDIASLGPASQNRLKAILANKVNNRIQNGTLAGPAYKQVVSDLGKQVAAIRNNPQGDAELASVLEGVAGAIENAARRHSNPDAVALLDAADAGYAKLVRIEEAAKRKGGDAGTFSPNAFDSSVQKTSGGIRSKAYLRGDALSQDYAKAGRSLEDKLPNSGTVDRGLQVGGIGVLAAGAYNPQVAAILGTIGTLYAPGVRKVMQGAMAPATGAAAKAISAQLAKRAQLVGRTSAAIEAASLPGTSPAP